MAFIDTLIAIRNGGAAIEISKALDDVVAGVRSTGKAGKLKFELTVKPASKGDVDTIFLQDKIVADVPKPDKKLTLFFANENNQLTREDTRQMNMLDGMKEIDVDAADVKEIN